MNSSLSEDIDAELEKRWYQRSSSALRQRYIEKRENPRKQDSRITMWAAILSGSSWT